MGKGRINYITKLLLKSFLLYKETFIVQNIFPCVGGGVGEGRHGGCSGGVREGMGGWSGRGRAWGVEWGREGMGRGGVGEGGHG